MLLEEFVHQGAAAEGLGRIYDEAGERLVAAGKNLAAVRAELPKLQGSEAVRTTLCDVLALRRP